MRARLSAGVGRAAELAGVAARQARFLPGVGAAACAVVAGALVHPALAWAVAALALLALDRRIP